MDARLSPLLSSGASLGKAASRQARAMEERQGGRCHLPSQEQPGSCMIELGLGVGLCLPLGLV